MAQMQARACALMFLFCTAAAVQAQTSTPGASQTEQKPKDDVPAKIDLSSSKTKEKTESFLLPVPSEIVARIQRTPYGKNLSATVELQPRKFEALPPWKKSLALGVATSDVVLALETSPKAKILVGLDNVIAGMKSLDFPSAKVQEVTALREGFAADKLSKAKVTSGFDSLRADLLNLGQALLGSQKYGLLIVGAWSSGAHASAALARTEPRALEDIEILKVRKVIDTFIRLVGSQAEVAPVIKSLNQLRGVTTDGRVTAPTAREAGVIESATAEILSLIAS